MNPIRRIHSLFSFYYLSGSSCISLRAAQQCGNLSWFLHKIATTSVRTGFAMTGVAAPSCHCEERSDVAISCGSYRAYMKPFTRTVCRLRVGTTESSCPTTVERTLTVEADDSVRLCRNHRLRTNSFILTVCRLRGRRGHVPALQGLLQKRFSAFNNRTRGNSRFRAWRRNRRRR